MDNSKANNSDASQEQPEQKPGKRLRQRILSPWLFVILLLAAAGGVYLQMEEQEKEEPGPDQERAIAVEIAPATHLTLLDTVRGVGSLEAVQRVEIKPEARGRIKATHFQEGNFVNKNQLLFEIEQQKLLRRLAAQQAALEEARARLQNIRRNYERFSMLHEQEVVSEEEYEQVRTDLESARAETRRLRAEVEHIQEEMEDTTIRAPFDGYISERLVDPGTFVNQGETLTVMYQTHPLEISFFVPERHAARASLDQEVRVRVAAYPEQYFKGKVRYISPSIDESTRKFRVRATIDNPDHKLKPGFFAQSSLVLGERDDALVVPEQALVSTREGYMVYTVDKDEERVQGRNVEIGLRRPGLVEIVRGLDHGDIVVKSGHMELEEGARVNIVQELDADWATSWDERPSGTEPLSDMEARQTTGHGG